jgi:hypothetical protein
MTALTAPVSSRAVQPLNLGNAFDLALPLADRCDCLMQIVALAAELTVQRDEQDTPDAYADPTFREQEVRRRTLRGIEDLRQASNMMELRWAMANGHERWTDADGAEVSLLEVIEGQMPDEEQRKSSGRARQMWAFVAGEHSAVAAFREQGISDQRIAECATSGMSSVLGIVSSYRKKLEDAYPEEDLHELYEELIEVASEATILSELENRCKQMVDPTDVPPPGVPYSIEDDGNCRWAVLHPTEDQWNQLVWRRLKDVLEIDRLLPEAFARYWQQGVPAGQTSSR